jgi:glutaredoxin-like protein
MTIRVLGTTWCGDCTRSKALLDAHGVSYEWIDVEQDETANDEATRLNQGERRVPTIVFPDGSVLIEPSDAELSTKLGL